MRVFVVIAGKDYASPELPQLNGTLKDGHDLATVFLEPALGDYESARSKLLVSPTLTEVQKAFDKILESGNRISCLSIYFGGHGIAHKGAYYLCLNDTVVDRLSTTSLPLNHIFNFVNDVDALQTNIIIDACEAGALVGDIGSLVKPEILGKEGTSGISLFASSMRDQSALEDDNGGIATQALIKCMRGDECVDTVRPYLDLAMIGRHVSQNVINRIDSQTPTAWGFNLTGLSTFSKNPYFHPSLGDHPWPIFLAKDLELLHDEKDKIWIEYLKIADIGATFTLIDLLVGSVLSLEQKGMSVDKIGAFILGTAEGMSLRASESQDMFCESEVLIACGVAFLPILKEATANRSFKTLVNRIHSAAHRAFINFLNDSESNNDALLGKSNLLGDLYFLPLRITKLLGWIGLVEHIQNYYDIGTSFTDQQVDSILDTLYKHYNNSFVCVADEQAPYLFLFSEMKNFKKQNERFRLPIQLFFNDFVSNKGKLLGRTAQGEDILNYLLSRNNGDYTQVSNLLAQPSELLSVIFNAAARIQLNAEFDTSLMRIDHTTLNIFVPDTLETFYKRNIEAGVNITMQIGSESELGIFSVEDFGKIKSNFCLSRTKLLGGEKEIILSAIFMSFIVPDRVPWFLENLITAN